MLYYRTKKEANNKPMYMGKRRDREEKWSIYIADELFTEKEVCRLNLNMDYLEPVEIPRLQTHKQGCFRVANFDATITKVEEKPLVEPLSKEATRELVKKMKDRELYKARTNQIPDARPATIMVGSRCQPRSRSALQKQVVHSRAAHRSNPAALLIAAHNT